MLLLFLECEARHFTTDRLGKSERGLAAVISGGRCFILAAQERQHDILKLDGLLDLR